MLREWLTLLGASSVIASGPSSLDVRTAERISTLEDMHGYFPCMDCHADQETNRTPRFLEEEHETPLEWDDDEGDTHYVQFGELISFRDLLGRGDLEGSRGRNLIKIGERLGAAEYMKEQGLSESDSIHVLTHGGANLWCLDCHSPGDRDSLHKLNGELLSFDESHLLCGQCHGPMFSDWEHGVHGRTNGYWNRAMDADGVTRRLLCTECHIPHAPGFQGTTPDPAPVARLDNISHPDHESRHVTHRGDRDDLGPHPWVGAVSSEHAEEGATP